jgi:NTE family protein
MVFLKENNNNIMEVTLALGGGGVKGYAHIGVLRHLESCGIKFRAIAGTSAGGLFGAIFAAGFKYEELEEFIHKLDQGKFYKRLPGDGPSLLGLGGVIDLLEELFDNRTFDDLKIPLSVTAVDLETGQPVVIDSGRVVDAILATIALPGIFPPRQLNGRLLVDGGVVDPIPIRLAREMAPDAPVVAVVLTPKIRNWNGQKDPPIFLSSLPLINQIYRFRLAQSLNIFMRSVDIASCFISDRCLEIEKPDFVIRPAVENVGLVDQVDIQEVVNLGEKAAEKMIPQMKRVEHLGYRFPHRLPWLENLFKRSSI